MEGDVRRHAARGRAAVCAAASDGDQVFTGGRLDEPVRRSPAFDGHGSQLGVEPRLEIAARTQRPPRTGDPSTPTTILRGDQTPPAAGFRATRTEHAARWSIRVATLPSKSPGDTAQAVSADHASDACLDVISSRRPETSDPPASTSPVRRARHLGARSLESSAAASSRSSTSSSA